MILFAFVCPCSRPFLWKTIMAASIDCLFCVRKPQGFFVGFLTILLNFLNPPSGKGSKKE